MQTFTVKNADGQAVHYQCTPHGAIEGSAIALELMRAAAPVVTMLGDFEALFRATASGSVLDASVDMESVGRTIQGALAVPGLVPLVRRVLGNTLREGADLSSDSAFDAAYQANYLELWVAVWKVIQINRFLPLPATSKTPSE